MSSIYSSLLFTFLLVEGKSNRYSNLRYIS